MLKANRKLFIAAALLIGAINFGACSSASTNTVSTGNTNAAGTANVTNTNKTTNTAPADSAPSNSIVQPANTTSQTKPEMKKEEMLSADAPKSETTGVPECDEYIAKYEACLTGKVPEPQRAAFVTPLEEMKKNLKAAADNPQAKAALAGGCKQSLTVAKQSMSAFSCSW